MIHIFQSCKLLALEGINKIDLPSDLAKMAPGHKRQNMTLINFIVFSMLHFFHNNV